VGISRAIYMPEYRALGRKEERRGGVVGRSGYITNARMPDSAFSALERNSAHS